MNWFEEGYRQLNKKKLPRLYLSGQMNGLPDNGYPLFNAKAKILRDKGYDVVNPAENPDMPSWEDYLRIDIANMLSCDAIAIFPNWRNSRGATLELYIAQQLKMPVYCVETMQLLPEETILEEANRLVNGERQGQYGHPYDDYLCATDMFNEWRRHKYGAAGPQQLTPDDGTMFMVFVKLSREANKHKRDNLVDAAGYLQCYDMVLKKKQELHGK